MPAINLGSSAIGSLRVGSTAASKLYLGATEVWSSAPACTQSALLLHFDGDDEDTTTTDSSVNGYSVTFDGSSEISTTQSKWGGSSLLVAGTGGGVDVSASSALNFGSGDFTAECWVYLNANKDSNGIFCQRDLSSDAAGVLFFCSDTGEIRFFISNGSGGWSISNHGTGLTLGVEQWHHVAMVRYGNTVTAYLDGTAGTPTTFSGDPGGGSGFYVGARSGDGESTLDGYIDDFRVVKGLAVYQDEFDVPTEALSACATVAPPATNPLLTDLVAFYKLSDNTDSSGNGYTLTETNVTYDTGKVGNSAVFDGTAYLSTSSLPSFASDMTLTLWFKITGEDSEDFLIGCGSSDGSFYVVRASGDVKSAVSGSGEVFAGGSGAADGEWHFAAVVRTATTMKVWLDATSGSGSGTYSSIASPSPFKIGSNFDGTYLLMNGNIDAVGLWSRALSDAEIAEMYASGSGIELP